MTAFKCKMCGASLEVPEGATSVTCDYCRTQQTLPRLDDDRRANLYDRGNHFRRASEYDKAMRIFEQVLSEDANDAEAYWSIVLCRYGVEYVEDPATGRRIPTVNRMQASSILADEDYRQALAHADLVQRGIYESQAKEIAAIQEGIAEVAAKEEPFDVFICYKETDAQGQRTRDSVLANDLYHELTREGFRVFFARITLEDKLGQAYEPYIYSALQSSKAMVVIGTKPEYVKAPWVKNEWSRYLALIKAGARKTLIPAYRDMDPYDLPEEFSHLQAQDMSKLGFMQDLVRGIKKVCGKDEVANVVQPTPVVAGSNAVTALLKRAYIFLADKEWDRANEYAERILDTEPENADAYLVKVMAELQESDRSELTQYNSGLLDMNDFERAIQYAKGDLAQEVEHIRYSVLANEFEDACKWAEKAEKTTGLVEAWKRWKRAEAGFKRARDYPQSEQRAAACREKKNHIANECEERAKQAKQLMRQAQKQLASDKADKNGKIQGDFRKARDSVETISAWQGVSQIICECNAGIKEAKQRTEELESQRYEAAGQLVCYAVAAIIVIGIFVIPICRILLS